MTNISSKNKFDVNKIRADFPILSLKVNDKPLVYFDNGASAQKPSQVIDGMADFYKTKYSNVHRGIHYLSNAATEVYEEARIKVRNFLGAQHEEEIIFTKSATEAINLVAYSYGMENIKEGDEIIISIMEHHSNIVPWNFIREKFGAIIKWIPVSDEGELLVEELPKLITDKTKMIAITHMSNMLGTLNPIKQICKIASDSNIKVLIDGSQGAVHNNVDVVDIDCDFYVITGHKLYGPSGVGVLYGKREVLSKMRPFLGGGEMIKDVSIDKVSYANLPHRFEAGTPPIAQVYGLGLALDYIKSIGLENIKAHEDEIYDYAYKKISGIKDIRVFGTHKNKGAILSFSMGDIHAHDISTVIDKYGVAVRAGTHCVQPLLQRYGVTSTCRASFAMYNTKKEVDIFIEALKKAQMFFS